MVLQIELCAAWRGGGVVGQLVNAGGGCSVKVASSVWGEYGTSSRHEQGIEELGLLLLDIYHHKYFHCHRYSSTMRILSGFHTYLTGK